MRLKFLICFFLATSVDCFSQYSERLFEQSVKAFDSGKMALADSLITQSINYERNNFQSDYLKYYNRGIFRQAMDSIPLAIKDFDTALILKKDFYPALENRAICYYYWGETKKADTDIDQGIKIKPDHIEAYALSAIFNLHLKDYKKAIISCSKGLTIKKDPRLYAYRAICNIKLGKYDFALKDIGSGETYFGLFDRNLMEAKLYYYFVKNNSSFCELKGDYLSHNYIMNFISFRDESFEKSYNDCK